MIKQLLTILTFGTFLLVSLVGGAKAQVASTKAVPDISRPVSTGKFQPLKEALKSIEQEYEVNIMYQSALVQDEVVKREALEGENVNQILKRILKPLGLTFVQIDINDYVLKIDKTTPKKLGKRSGQDLLQENEVELPKVEPTSITQKKIQVDRNRLQQREITGIVLDENGESLPGTNVLVKGTAIGTVTDLTGRYTLTVPDDAEVLVFSFVGYLSEEVQINNQSVIDIAMTPDITTLTDVVVVGYGQTKKEELIGSVGKVEAKTIEKLPITTFEEALAGQVAGVNVRFNTGVPGGAPEITIRGLGSINGEGAGNSPLFVIDGFIYGNTNNQFENPLAGLAPGDIESISVLKDAASASLYGSQASSGVVIITTKTGRGPTRVTFDSYIGVQTTPERVRPNVLNGHELAQFNREKWIDKYFQDNGEFPTDAELEENDVIDPADFDAGTDWFDELTQNGIIQNYTISASGGNKNVNYYVSANYFDQEGIVVETGFRRYSLRANIDTKLGDKVKFGVRMTPSQAVYERNGGTDPSRDFFDVSGTVFTSNWLGPDVRFRDFRGDLVPFDRSELISSVQNNPVWEQEVRKSTQTINQFNANTFIEYSPIEGLTIKPTFGIGVNANRTQAFRPELLGDGIAPSFENLAASQAAFVYNENFRWQSENLVTYQRTFGQDHDIDLLGAFTVQRAEGLGQQTTTRNLLEPFELPNSDNVELFIPNTDIPVFTNIETFPTDFGSSQVSFIGRAKYDYKDTYLATAAFRRDGSSRFGERVQFANFPSLALGWRASNENFFQNLGISDIVSNVLFEASYGELGNNRIGDFTRWGGIRLSGNGYVFGGQLVQGRASGNNDLPNANLTWERTREFAFGIDLGFLGDRFIFEADYYRRDIFDLLNNESLPLVTGFPQVFGNIGDLESEGLELLVKTVNIDRGKLKWTSDVNVTFNEVTVARLGEDNDPIFREAVNGGNSNLFQIRVGDPLGLFYGLRYEGLYTEDDFDENGNLLPGVPGYNGGGGPPVVGSAKFFDANGNGGTDQSGDGVVIGDANPDFIFGINNYVTYGPWNLKVIMTGAVGQQIYDRTFELLNNFDPVNGREDLSTFNVHENVKERYRPGDDPSTKTVPGTAGGDAPWRWANSAHVKDAGYLSVRNITLSFDFAQYLQQRDKLGFLKGGSVYVSVQNAFIFTPFEGNPEVGRANAGPLRPNVNFGSYPIARIFTGGLTVTF